MNDEPKKVDGRKGRTAFVYIKASDILDYYGANEMIKVSKRQLGDKGFDIPPDVVDSTPEPKGEEGTSSTTFNINEHVQDL